MVRATTTISPADQEVSTQQQQLHRHLQQRLAWAFLEEARRGLRRALMLGQPQVDADWPRLHKDPLTYWARAHRHFRTRSLEQLPLPEGR